MRLTINLVILSIMSAVLLIYGLRGIVVKRPVVYPGRSRYWFVVLGFAPSIVYTATGILMLLMVIYLTVSRIRRGV